MSTIFFTGFPGFLGTELLPRILRREPDAVAVCLVQEKFHDMAAARADELIGLDSDLAGRIEIVDGDITDPELGLGHAYDELAAKTTSIYHLAAVYDLAVGRDLAMKINVDGTTHVCDFAKACTGLDRLHYISTCYVSGRHTGVFTEDDLELGQEFNNFYEETKHLAEVVVRERMAGGLPATIYRPAIVSGDSRTGATQKADGPLFIVNWVLRQPAIGGFMPMVGQSRSHTMNIVPRDFVLDGITHLSGLEVSKGRCYALADPRPLSIDQLVTTIADAADRRLLRVTLPHRVAKNLLRVGPIRSLLGMPADVVDYLTHPTHYATTSASSDLDGSGVAMPDRREWVANLVRYQRENPGISSAAMV